MTKWTNRNRDKIEKKTKSWSKKRSKWEERKAVDMKRQKDREGESGQLTLNCSARQKKKKRRTGRCKCFFKWAARKCKLLKTFFIVNCCCCCCCWRGARPIPQLPHPMLLLLLYANGVTLLLLLCCIWGCRSWTR